MPKCTRRRSHGLRILHMTRNLEIGGLERLVVDLAACQAQSGHRSAIMELCEPMVERIAVPRIVVHIDFKRDPGSGPCRSWSGLYRAIQDFRPDVVHAHNSLALRRAVLPCLLGGIPVIMTKHGMDLVSGIGGLVYGGARYIACVSEEIHRKLTDTYPSLSKRAEVVPNGVSFESVGRLRREQVRAELKLGSECLAFLWAGRLVREKELDVLIEGFRRTQTQAWRLFLIGDGPLRCQLQEQARASELHDRVIFMGRRCDVRELLKGFDVFIMPSISEGLPMALLEAAAAGLPVIVSDVGAMPTVTRNRNGWVVPSGNAAALAACIGTACGLRFEFLRDMGQRSSELVRERFSIDTCAERYGEAYERFLRPTTD
jgi:glycosyltransferase involved in cell wall biosynthesis